MTNAIGSGQSFDLRYDEDNRVTSLHWNAGVTEKTIDNRLDAIGRRIARTEDGVETRYVLDLAVGMEMILCDTDIFGAVKSRYVYGPGGLAYRVDATNGVLCYHSDAQGNIISLTDSLTNTVAQYAYTPYGRILPGSTSDGNPYRFSGAFGVMEEVADLYFMRARYYSAEAGVFLSTDPVKKVGPGWKPVAYGYADGNPLSYSDATGEMPHALLVAGVGALIGGGVELTSQLINGQGIDWSKIGGAAVKEGVTYGLVSLGLNPSVAGTIGGLAGEMTHQLTDGDEGVNWTDVGATSVGGAISGAFMSKDTMRFLGGGRGWNIVSGAKGAQTTAAAAQIFAKNEIISNVGTQISDKTKELVLNYVGGNGSQSPMSGKAVDSVAPTEAKNNMQCVQPQPPSISKTVSTAIKTVVEKTQQVVSQTVKIATQVSQKVQSAVNTVKTAVSSAVSKVTSAVKSVGNAIASLFKKK